MKKLRCAEFPKHLGGLLLALALLASIAMPAAAQRGAPPPTSVPPPPFDWPVTPPVIPLRIGSPIGISSYTIDATIDNQVAHVKVVQRFVNSGETIVEAAYLFPLPADAAVSGFSMTVDGERLDGKVLDKDQARAIYESYVRQRRDPALLAYLGQGVYQTGVFPIPGGAERTVELAYDQVVPSDGELYRFVFPLRGSSMTAESIASLALRVRLSTPQRLHAIYSPSHDITIQRDGENRATVGLEQQDAPTKRDFELVYSAGPSQVGATMMSYRPAEDPGYFLLFLTPPVAAETQAVVARDILLVLDTSGSMDGEKLAQAKKALDFILDHLNPDDHFNIVQFSSGLSRFAPDLQPASAHARARAWVAGLSAGGGTDINLALLDALSQADGARPTVVIFLTDGLPTVGEVNADRIIANVDQHTPARASIFTFGVGYDVNTILLDTLAQEHRGAGSYVTPDETIDEIISAFYARIGTPVLADPVLQADGVTLQDVYPSPLPDLFAGSQLIVAGRYRGAGPVTLTLKGTVNGAPVIYTYPNLPLAASMDNDFMAPLWANRKVGYLLTQMRLHGRSAELVDEVMQLGLRYGIVTPFTSFLVEEPGLVEGPPALLPLSTVTTAMRDQALKAPQAAASGQAAVQDSEQRAALAQAERAPAAVASQLRQAGAKTFLLRQVDGTEVWVDTTYEAARMPLQPVVFGSDAYFSLAGRPGAARYLSVGEHVIVVLQGTAYEVRSGPATAAVPQPAPEPAATPSWLERVLSWLGLH